MAVELATLNIPLKAAGEDLVTGALKRIDAVGRTTASRLSSFQFKVTGTAAAAQALASVDRAGAQTAAKLRAIGDSGSGLDAIRRRTELLSEGLARASTRAASLRQLEGAERSLTRALAAGNLTLSQQIQLERELLRVRSSLATVRPAPPVAPGAGGAVAGALTGARSQLAGFGVGFLGGAAIGVATQLLSGFTQTLMGSANAADAAETSQRKLSASAKVLGVDLATLERTAAQARDTFLLDAVTATDLSVAATKLASRAGDSARSLEAMNAWLDLSAANGLNATEALQALTTTLIGQDEGLNRLGLSNPQQIYEAWAKAAGVSAAKMTDAEKSQAVLNAVVVAASKVEGEYAKSLDSSAGKAAALAKSQRELQQELGALIGPIRNLSNEFVTGFLQGSLKEFRGIKRAIADLINDASRLGTALEDAMRFVNVVSGSSTIGVLPDLVVDGMTPEEMDKRVKVLAEAIALGTASADERREAISLSAGLAQTARAESVAIEIRNRAQALANDLLDAFNGRASDASTALRERTGHLLALLRLEGPTGERWEELRRRAEELTEKLAQQNLTLAERRAILEEIASIEDPATGIGFKEPAAPERIRRRNETGLDIRGAETIALPELPVTEWARGLSEEIREAVLGLADLFNETAEEALSRMEDTASSLAETFADGVRGAFDSAFSGGNVLEGAAKAILAGLGSIFMRMGMAMIAASPIFMKLAAALWNPFTSGPALLAHGILLTALGASLGAIAHGIGGGSSSTGAGVGGGAPAPQIINIGASGNTRSVASAPPTAAAAASRVDPMVRIQVPITLFGPYDPRLQSDLSVVVEEGVQRGLFPSLARRGG